MKVYLLLTLLALVAASEDFNTNEIKKRMKLIGGIPSYGTQNSSPKAEADDGLKMDAVDYTEADLLLNYNATAHLNPKGMGHLFCVTRFFLDHIQPNVSFPDDLLVDDGRGLRIGDVKERWPAWLSHYSAIAVVVAVGAAFALLMPFIGLFFCCCRCGGKCGATTKHDKHHHESCKRTTVAILLSAVAVVILFGVVCAFVTNEHMKEGIDHLADNITVNLHDAKLYLNNTEKEVDNLLITNFNQLRHHVMHLINSSGEIVKDQLAVISHAVALKNLTTIVDGMEVIKQDLAAIHLATTRLQHLASTLADDLDVTRDELLKELHNCRDIPACRQLLNHRHIAELQVIENFNELLDRYFPKLPNVAHTFATISRLLGDRGSIDSIQKNVLEGQRNFSNIKYEISESMPYVREKLEQAFSETEGKLGETSAKIKRLLRSVRELIEDVERKPVRRAREEIGEYAVYRYYLGLGVSGSLLLVLFCITLGLLCGICGKRPEEMYSDDGDCCNTISGGRFLMLAVWLIFLISSALMVIALGHFLLGVTADMMVCKPLKNPSDSKVFQLVDKYAKISEIYQQDGGKRIGEKEEEEEEVKVSEVILSVHRNESVYKALKLENVANITQVLEYIHKFELPREIQEFKNKIRVRTDRLQLLSPEAKSKLRDLAESPLNDIHFDKYSKLLTFQITNINLTTLSRELFTNADKIPEHASSGFDLSKVKKLLRAKARFLELLERDSVAQIRNEMEILKANVTTLKEHLRFNHTSLKEALDSLLEEVDGAQSYLRKNGTAQLKTLLDELVKRIQNLVKEYLNRVVEKTQNDIGKTAPLSNAYNATVVAGCNRIMDPFNGFWLSVGWSVLLFIPVVVLSVKLASLYSKAETYGPPGMYGESEYLYDAYADRDNMPLAMAQSDKKKKNHHKSTHDNYDNSGNGAYLQDYSAHLGRSDRPSASNDARYNDMAPKHWGDFANPPRSTSNPPRYHHPSSTEYERPPPYYYPGPERA